MITTIKRNQLLNRQLVGYVRSYGCFHSCEVQTDMIQKYCRQKGLNCTYIYIDSMVHDRRANEREYAQELGLPTQSWFSVHPEFEQMLLSIKRGEIGTILVDTELRLEGSNIENQVFQNLCVEYGVEVLTVEPEDYREGKLQTAIYHFTDESKYRPSVACKVIDKLYIHTHIHNLEHPYLYFDRSLKKNERKQWDKLLKHLDEYRALLVDSFCHTEQKTVSFVKFVCRYADKIHMLSVEEGELKVLDMDWMDKELKVAYYTRSPEMCKKEKSEFLLRRLQAFVEVKAPNWIMSGCYIDESRDSPKLQQLMKDHVSYDMLVVEKFSMLGERTNALMNVWKQIGKIPIYSIEEGGLMLCEHTDESFVL